MIRILKPAPDYRATAEVCPRCKTYVLIHARGVKRCANPRCSGKSRFGHAEIRKPL